MYKEINRQSACGRLAGCLISSPVSGATGASGARRGCVHTEYAVGLVCLVTQIDVQELGCDFLVGSAHKMYGPTGVGFLFGRYQLLRDMPPWKAGGEMIEVSEG